MRVQIEADAVRIRLSWWQKLFGLMRDITIALPDIDGAEVVENPVSVATRAGIKVGLRLPFLYFAARTLRLDEAFVVRRGVPGLSISIGGDGHLRRALVSTPDAAELASRIESARRTAESQS
jgi:hypothetical protein